MMLQGILNNCSCSQEVVQNNIGLFTYNDASHVKTLYSLDNQFKLNNGFIIQLELAAIKFSVCKCIACH